MRNRYLLIGLIAALSLGGCERHSSHQSAVDLWLSESDRPRVLSTTGMIDDLVREVGGNAIARLTLIGNALDPHSYELVKGDDEKLAGADLIFYNGLGLEHGASLSRYLDKNERAVAVGEAIVSAKPEAVVRIDGQIDPHIWADASLWLQAVDAIVDSLTQLAPDQAEVFSSRGAALKERLHVVDQSVMTQMRTIPSEQRYVVTSHDAFNYFARRYLAEPEECIAGTWERRCVAPEGLSPEGQLSAVDIQSVMNHLLEHRIEVVFAESNLNQDSIRKLIDAGSRCGLSIALAEEALFADAMGEPGSGADTYERMMLHNARTIASRLGEKKE